MILPEQDNKASKVTPSDTSAEGSMRSHNIAARAGSHASTQPPPYTSEGSSHFADDSHGQEVRYFSQPSPSPAPRAFASSPSTYGSAAGTGGVPRSPTALDASPPAFSRLPSQEAGYPSFPAIYLMSNGKHITKGFPLVPPPSSSEYHPFMTHDVTQEDWQSFVNDVNQAAELTAKDKVQAYSLPFISIVPLINSVAGLAVTTYMKKRKEVPVSKRINAWNHYFFHPRRMDVILMRGQQRIGRPQSDNEGELASSEIVGELDGTYHLCIRPKSSA
ncbi:hypothetical protein CCMSSC00406_0010250 [Pleurotus cornucopiae]|uniref:Uncharacterized protein n=1 Tax=Pleurotus cornucopiae TaxID=5321 RepID=A0ACB7IM89_PLECO|nr:hypothetical protein CCMSSC00406_0010250 [Pleurotus cornucopiae]